MASSHDSLGTGEASSPFYDKPRIAENALAFALRDGFPVSPGHTLVVPKRLVATWFDATRDEQHALMELVETVKNKLDAEFRPDGYNVGFNAGRAAGQTVMHLHLHVIPRYQGDVADPRGGVRHIIPGKGNYLATAYKPGTARREALSTGGHDDPFIDHVAPLLARAQQIAIMAAFSQQSGVDVLEASLLAAARRGARVRLITGDYLNITQKVALESMLGWMAQEPVEPGVCLPEVRIVETARLPTSSQSFHPKSWIFIAPEFGTAFVGSSNVSYAALHDGIEWNLRVDRERDRAAFERVVEAFETCWMTARVLDADFLRAYRDRVRSHDRPVPPGEVGPTDEGELPQPHALQGEALEALQRAREEGRKRALVVMATGLGKTWLAVFDLFAISRAADKTPRMLFVAHRDELLRQASATFALRFPKASRGFFVGDQSELDTDFVFASVQKLAQKTNLQRLATQKFDYVVIDEVHHATARSYRAVLGAVDAGFVLGLTATPDRLDQADVLSLLDDHLAYRADLVEGIKAGLLAPFSYFGLCDTIDYKPIPWRNGRFDPAILAQAVQTEARMERAWQGWQDHPGTKTLIFCCTIEHANFVQSWLSTKGVRVEAVHSGEGSADRTTALTLLARGDLDAVCAVDLFNEGIDVPAIDRVVMLRPSESPVVFLQQLGRGLRKQAAKVALTVLDFVGNHRIFLDRLRILLDTKAPAGITALSPPSLGGLREGRPTDLPPGCSIQLDLEAIKLLEQLMRLRRGDMFGQRFREILEERGERPTAVEMYRVGFDQELRKGWMKFLASEGQLVGPMLAVYQDAGRFLDHLETTTMTKCFKMITLQALIEADALTDGMLLVELSERSHKILARSPELFRDLQDLKDLPDPRAPNRDKWLSYWRKNPIKAWTEKTKEESGPLWFAIQGDRFVPTFSIRDPETRAALAQLVSELVDWRLAQYRDRPSKSGTSKPELPLAAVTQLPLRVPANTRTRVPAYTELQIAAGWPGTMTDATDLQPDASLVLSEDVPKGAFAVQVTGRSMEGVRSEIREGAWILCTPSGGAEARAFEDQVVIVARGDAESQSFHLKRVKTERGTLTLRSDNPSVAPMPWTPNDRVVASFVRVVAPTEIVPQSDSPDPSRPD